MRGNKFPRYDQYHLLPKLEEIYCRITRAKLAKILPSIEDLEDEEAMDIEVEIEYGNPVVSQYKLDSIESTDTGIMFVLANKKTDCLAPDKCGITPCCEGLVTVEEFQETYDHWRTVIDNQLKE